MCCATRSPTPTQGRADWLAPSGDDEAGVITISTMARASRPKDLPQVFNRFHRALGGGVAGEAALGLGLPLTRQFIEAHGGTVELESKRARAPASP
jgi:K+-sensing histidine kinase KdpD